MLSPGGRLGARAGTQARTQKKASCFFFPSAAARSRHVTRFMGPIYLLVRGRHPHQRVVQPPRFRNRYHRRGAVGLLHSVVALLGKEALLALLPPREVADARAPLLDALPRVDWFGKRCATSRKFTLSGFANHMRCLSSASSESVHTARKARMGTPSALRTRPAGSHKCKIVCKGLPCAYS